MANPLKTYRTFIETAKTYANKGEEWRLKLMLLLIELEPQKSIWMENPHKITKWDALLQQEGLCTPALYAAFKAAFKIKSIDVHRFGVYASASIARMPKDNRDRVIAMTAEWIKTHRVPPHYQRVSEYLKQLRTDLKIKPKTESPLAKLRRENKRLEGQKQHLEARVEQLLQTLKRHNIRPPKET